MAKLRSLFDTIKIGAAGLAMGYASGASATPIPTISAISYPAASIVSGAFGCNDEAQILSVSDTDKSDLDPSSKSMAILGGELSALELIKRQQVTSTNAPSDFAGGLRVPKLEPSTSRGAKIGRMCSFATGAVFSPAVAKWPLKTRTSDFLASRRIEISKTSFDDAWNRVSNEKISGRLLGSINHEFDRSVRTIEFVNRWVNRQITYVEDRELFGEADHWAGARTTLLLRKGDCEDIALTKMQILLAAGFPRKDIFLTIARDTIIRTDHALLIVRLGDRFVALDNATDKLLDAAQSHSYVPVLSFSDKRAWIHGFSSKVRSARQDYSFAQSDAFGTVSSNKLSMALSRP